MLLEFFLLNTATSIVKAAFVKGGLHIASSSIAVYSYFDVLHSIHSSKDLGIAGLKVGYGMLSDETITYLVHRVQHDTYEIQRRQSGLYVAGSALTSRTLLLDSYSEFHASSPQEFSSAQASHTLDHRATRVVTHIRDHRVDLRTNHVNKHKPAEE